MTLLVKKPRKRKPLTLFDLKNPYAIVEVRNSKTDKDTIPSDACIDYYFKEYGILLHLHLWIALVVERRCFSKGTIRI